MTRVEFTINIVALLRQMIFLGEHPIIDFVKRSPEEQKRLFEAGYSDCDGVNNISKHQVGKAMDIYFIEENKMVDPHMGWEYWHDIWQGWGGKPRLLDENGNPWDDGHFEG